jgi:hypothetical protein
MLGRWRLLTAFFRARALEIKLLHESVDQAEGQALRNDASSNRCFIGQRRACALRLIADACVHRLVEPQQLSELGVHSPNAVVSCSRSVVEIGFSIQSSSHESSFTLEAITNSAWSSGSSEFPFRPQVRCIRSMSAAAPSSVLSSVCDEQTQSCSGGDEPEVTPKFHLLMKPISG